MAANPMISYPGLVMEMYEVREIEDKAKNTAAVLQKYGIPAEKLIIMGDGGGDGLHFSWSASVGAHLVGSMPKPSLENFCRNKGIEINTRFGVTSSEGEKRDPAREMTVGFMGLVPVIENVLGKL